MGPSDIFQNFYFTWLKLTIVTPYIWNKMDFIVDPVSVKETDYRSLD